MVARSWLALWVWPVLITPPLKRVLRVAHALQGILEMEQNAQVKKNNTGDREHVNLLIR